MSPPKWAPGAGGYTQGICSPGGKNKLGMRRERAEGSGCTLGCRAGLWCVLGVQCWPMGCSQGTRGQQGPAAATTAGCSGSSGASPWEPAGGGEPQILLGGSIAASCSGRASHPHVCAAAAEASPAPRGHWGCSEPAELHQPRAGSKSGSPCAGAEPSCSPAVPVVQGAHRGGIPMPGHSLSLQRWLGRGQAWHVRWRGGRRASPVPSSAVVSNPCLCSHGACCPLQCRRRRR